ncbi:hypothetical protein GCM10009589_20680 [Arthrobacter pascens]
MAPSLLIELGADRKLYPTKIDASTIIAANNNDASNGVLGADTINLPPNYLPFSPGLFAVDTAIPAAATGQADAWRISGTPWLQGTFAAIRGLAWLLAALLLAGLTGLLRND